MQRIAIIGCSGAGKSTLAKTLARKLNLLVIHLDAYYWQPGWQESDRDKWQKINQELIQGDRWVIDGNYGSTMDLRLAAADTIVWLDFNRYLCLWRIVKRYLQYYGKTRLDMGTGCLERLNWEFLQYVWNFPQLHRPKILNKLSKYEASKQIIVLQNPNRAIMFAAKT